MKVEGGQEFVYDHSVCLERNDHFSQRNKQFHEKM